MCQFTFAFTNIVIRCFPGHTHSNIPFLTQWVRRKYFTANTKWRILRIQKTLEYLHSDWYLHYLIHLMKYKSMISELLFSATFFSAFLFLVLHRFLLLSKLIFYFYRNIHSALCAWFEQTRAWTHSLDCRFKTSLVFLFHQNIMYQTYCFYFLFLINGIWNNKIR